MATIPFGIGIRAFVRPSWSRRFFFGGVKGQMHRHSGAWFSHRALEGNAHRSRHCCRGLLLSYAFATDHTPPFAILGALWLNTAPRPLCVRVSVHVYTAHAGDRPQKSGGARGCQWQRTLEARRWPFQAGNPREALCALFYTTYNVCISPASDNGSFATFFLFGQMRGRLHPDAGGSTAKDKSSHGTGSRKDFCVLDHGEGGCGIASFAARTIRIRHSGDCRRQGEVGAQEVAGRGAAIGKW